MKLISHCLTPKKQLSGILSLIRFSNLSAPSLFSALPPVIYFEASPKAISERTSYLRVRLEFLRYPHLIRYHFNGSRFGPPWSFTSTSTWTWIGHPVSGRIHLTSYALLRLAFATATLLNSLTLPQTITPWLIMRKARSHPCKHRAPTACKCMVSGTFNSLYKGAFHRSLTLLYTIGCRLVLSLGEWAPHLQSEFHGFRPTHKVFIMS